MHFYSPKHHLQGPPHSYRGSSLLLCSQVNAPTLSTIPPCTDQTSFPGSLIHKLTLTRTTESCGDPHFGIWEVAQDP